MNLDRPEVLRALQAAVALVFVVGLIGAFTVDSGGNHVSAGGFGDKPGSIATEVTGSTEPTPVVAETSTTAKAGTATTAKAAGTPSTVAGPVPDPGPAKAPTPGTYMYKTTSSTNNGPSETSDKFEALPDQNGAVRRKETVTDPQGNTLSNELAWTADSVHMLSSHIQTSGATIDCAWKPPILLLQFPMAIGKTWDSDSKCTTTFQGAQLTIHRVDHYKVTGKARDKVGTTSVPVWVLEVNSTTTINHPFFNQDTTEHQVTHLSPPHGLVTYETSTANANGQTITAERTLDSLTPK